MKLTNLAAQRLLHALRTIDQAEAIRLSGKVRLDIARNINRLMVDVQAFEKVLTGKQREMHGEEHVARKNAIMVELDELGDAMIDIKLWKFAPSDLSLDDNPRITGDVIAALAPILKDFDSMEPPE